MMDSLPAARTAIPAIGMRPMASKLFVTGYSQGGYVAMATHRALQAAGIPVTASAPDVRVPTPSPPSRTPCSWDRSGRGAVEEFVMLASSYQNSYGILYSGPCGDVREKLRGVRIGNLLPGFTGTATALVAQGSFPITPLFEQHSASAGATPRMTPATYTDRYASRPSSLQRFGADHLVTNSFRSAIWKTCASRPTVDIPIRAPACHPRLRRIPCARL